jgi:hypothetical protein
MQRKQQVGECWVCVILFARVVVSERMRQVHKGGVGGRSPPCGGQGAVPLEIFFSASRKRVMYLGGFFGTWFLPMVFYFG